MTVVGIDDTDAPTGGCTTHVGAVLADRLAGEATVHRRLLVRCNPAVEAKTRGNAAVAVHTDADPERALELARSAVAEHAVPGSDAGVVVAPGPPDGVAERVAAFARGAVRSYHELADAVSLAAAHSYRTASTGDGSGRIGALAAVGAWRAFDDWTTERIAYRAPDRWGTDRAVDPSAVFDAVAATATPGSPSTFDTVDRNAGEVLCTPRTPCPVLFGIRGDDPAAVRTLSDGIVEEAVAEPIERFATYVTNQGTDAHRRTGRIGALSPGYSYRVEGRVADAPRTERGGHVFVPVVAPDGTATVECAAFEPTERFRDRVRALRPGDRITADGEYADGTLKLERFALRTRALVAAAVPSCPDCGTAMESAGAAAGYRCRPCGTSATGRVPAPRERPLEVGWYEVPPRARRHLVEPLVRASPDAPVHPEH